MSHFRFSWRSKARYQSAAPTSFGFLYDEKRDKKETEYGSEILRVNDLFYLFFKFSYLPVNNCYHVLGSLQRDSMLKLQFYNTSSGHHVQFLKRAKEMITPLLLESYWVSRRKKSSKRFELGTLETVHQLPIYVRLWIVSQSHFSQEWERGRNTTSTQIFFLLVLLTVHQISYQDKVLLFCYFWSLLTYLNFQQELLKRADELLCARATRAQTGTKLVVNREWAKIQTLVALGPALQKKFLIYNHRPSWMTVVKSISQTVTCHIDKGFKLYYSQTSIIRIRGDWAEWSE